MEWRDISLTDIPFPSYILPHSGKVDLNFVLKREGNNTLWEGKVKVEGCSFTLTPYNILLKEIKGEGEITPEGWKTEKLEGKWEEMVFFLKGEGKLRVPYDYTVDIRLPQVEGERIKELFPSSFPERLPFPTGGEIEVKIQGNASIGIKKGEVKFFPWKDELLKNLHLTIAFEKGSVSLYSFQAELKKGSLQGKGKWRWNTPKP